MEEIAQYMGHNNPTVTFRGSRACQPQPSSQLPSGSTFGIHRSISGAERTQSPTEDFQGFHGYQ